MKIKKLIISFLINDILLNINCIINFLTFSYISHQSSFYFYLTFHSFISYSNFQRDHVHHDTDYTTYFEHHHAFERITRP